MQTVVHGFRAQWLGPAAAGVLVAFVGYWLAYTRALPRSPGSVPPAKELAATAVAGFGGLLARTVAIDHLALRRWGATGRDSRVFLLALSGMEQALLAVLGFSAACAVLVTGGAGLPDSFTLPWAVVPPPCLAVATWLVRRFHGWSWSVPGWRGRLSEALDAGSVVIQHLRHPDAVVLGMATFWLAEAFCLWASLSAFGYRANPAVLMVEFATGMLLTRRSMPLAGAGLMIVVLALTLREGGIPLGVALAGVVVYRVATVWLPIPASVALLPTLRRIGHTAEVRSSV